MMKIPFLDRFLQALSPSKKERRREPRRKDELPIEMEVLSGPEGSSHTNVLYAQIKNISAGGLKVLSSVYLPNDTSIKLKIILPDSGNSIEPEGKVVWVNRVGEKEIYEMGIEFKSTPPHILCTLLEYVYTDWE
jgi:c-di-GMP-binding flagellar brake protein YcgR